MMLIIISFWSITSHAVVQFTHRFDDKSTQSIPESWLVVITGDLKYFFPSVNAKAAMQKSTAAHANWPVSSIQHTELYQHSNLLGCNKKKRYEYIMYGHVWHWRANKSINKDEIKCQQRGKLVTDVLEKQHESICSSLLIFVDFWAWLVQPVQCLGIVVYELYVENCIIFSKRTCSLQFLLDCY